GTLSAATRHSTRIAIPNGSATAPPSEAPASRPNPTASTAKTPLLSRRGSSRQRTTNTIANAAARTKIMAPVSTSADQASPTDCRDRPGRRPPSGKMGNEPSTRGGSVSAATNQATGPTNGSEFAGLVAVVTGGASGLGLAIADELADRGASVAVLDAAEPAEPRHAAIRCNVTDTDSTDAAIASVVDQFGRIDVLVNNAGIGAAGTVADNDDDE